MQSRSFPVRPWVWSVLILLFFALSDAPLQGQGPRPPDPQFDTIPWQKGPCKANVGTMAEIQVPAGYKFTGPAGARQLLELLGNPTSPRDVGLLAPENGDWLLSFEYDDIGYVKDDDKNNLDANAILESLRKGNEEGNKTRLQKGWPTMEIIGWEQKPYYDLQTNNLSWAIRGRSEGHDVINHNTRVLGRGGVMSVVLIVDPAKLPATLPVSKQIMSGFTYKQGQRYAEWKAGDKVATYGLAALIAGGGTALAAKSGLLAKFGKAIIFVILAIVGGISAFFKKIFGRRSEA